MLPPNRAMLTNTMINLYTNIDEASYLHRKYIWQGFYRLTFLIGRKQARMLISDILQIRLFSNESSTTLCYVPLCVSLSLRITGKDDDRGDDDEKTMLLTMIMMIMKKDNNNSNDTYLPILIQHAAMIARGRRQVSTNMPILYLEYRQYQIFNIQCCTNMPILYLESRQQT